MRSNWKAALWGGVIGTLATALPAPAQPAAGPDPVAEVRSAEQAGARGDFAAAEAAWSRVLAARPGDTQARVARGNARAVQKKFDDARADFQAVLAREPGHVAALVGLGHTQAWSGRHTDALVQFDRALALAPDHLDAQRGAGYAELWRGQPAAAVPRFERVLAQAPQDSGAREGLAQARAALLSPGVRLEAQVWFGRTSLPGGEHETGLRSAEFGVWPGEGLRLFIRHDDGLSRDNAALARSDRGAALWSAGGYLRWSPAWSSQVQLGTRRFPGGVDQQLYQFEQTAHLERGFEVKAGGWFGPRTDDRDEWLAHVGGALPLGDRSRLEPTLFYSRNGLPGESEWRLALAASHRPADRWEIGAGFAAGQARTAAGSRGVREGSLRAAWTLTPQVALQLQARRETVEGGDGITVFAFGSTLVWR